MKFWPQLKQVPAHLNLLEDLRAQLAKDLGIELMEVPNQNLLEWLNKWLEANLYKIDLAQLLYRIDLEILSAERPQEIAEKILEREAQKVIFRAQYSGRI
ncbi:hypothetical protein [Croceimicrobium hydrocarbonivorans]|uniref:Uncharacterized protein n=1 Tax=Croceimicrobium hydrocarbonivorans TaxID=2761580 RepID=A0A7H0VID0_9FLAO|nr:hypothetical protein [Croceimicrobium hydrocarbonivorans]QNR25478.1 hypothetical protein H4K34_06455 [Croceimicrobium hydrocarbonivorans]